MSENPFNQLTFTRGLLLEEDGSLTPVWHLSLPGLSFSFTAHSMEKCISDAERYVEKRGLLRIVNGSEN